MSLEERIYLHLKELSEMDEYISSYLVKNIDLLEGQTISELEQKIHVSKSSILRCLKKLDFSGFSEFKYSIKSERQNIEAESKKEDIFALQHVDIEKTYSLVKSFDFSEVVSKIFEAKSIFLYTTGTSQRIVAKEFIRQMLYVRRPIFLLGGKTELDLNLNMIESDDLFLCISLSGETDDIKEDLLALKMRGIRIISFTSIGNNFLSRMSSESLYYVASEMSVNGVSEEISSFVGLNIVLDALFRHCVDVYNSK